MIKFRILSLCSVLLLFLLSTVSYAGSASNGQANCAFEKDSCETRAYVRKSINAYLKKGKQEVFTPKFRKAISELNSGEYSCYFPLEEEDVGLFQRFIEEGLIPASAKENEAASLIIDLYILYHNFAEYSEYFCFEIIPLMASDNMSGFVEILYNMDPAKRAKCISCLNGISDPLLKQRLREQIEEIDNEDYLDIVKSILIQLG